MLSTTRSFDSRSNTGKEYNRWILHIQISCPISYPILLHTDIIPDIIHDFIHTDIIPDIIPDISPGIVPDIGPDVIQDGLVPPLEKEGAGIISGSEAILKAYTTKHSLNLVMQGQSMI
jgi:hypothetical protein